MDTEAESQKKITNSRDDRHPICLAALGCALISERNSRTRLLGSLRSPSGRLLGSALNLRIARCAHVADCLARYAFGFASVRSA
jgi:hypothetical protein